jgi:anion-transporting  ArsA/GET3 family ATPase
MDPAGFCTQAKVMIVAGKGGVGKTTVSAALAGMAARAGLRTLIVEVDAASGLGALYDHDGPLDYHSTVLTPPGPGTAEVSARTLTPDDALLEYLEDHGLRRLSRRLTSTGTLEVVATAIPGIKDLLVLGKVKQLERAGAADLIVVDAPAAGHAVTFLASAHGVIDAAAVGPIRAQAEAVVELITDPARCQVLMVTLPEETPVNEVVETAFHLEDRAGVHLMPVVVNAVWPQLDLGTDEEVGKGAPSTWSATDLGTLGAAAEFRERRQALQQSQVARLAEKLPLTQLHLPYLFSTEIGPDGLESLIDSFTSAVGTLP